MTSKHVEAHLPERCATLLKKKWHCCFSSDSAPTFTIEPPVQNPLEGNNITLEWSYNFGSGSYRQVIFGSDDISIIVEKSFSDNVPYIAPAFSGRLLANVTDIYTSITFLAVNRNDSNSYTLTIVSNSRESVDSKLEISVQCKYIFCYASVCICVCVYVEWRGLSTG